MKDYGLTKDDSYHARQLAEYKEIIAEVIVNSLDIPTRAAVEKEIKRRESEERKDRPPPPLPEGIYDVIYADPPWQYDNAIDNWGPATKHYSTLPTNDIAYYKDGNGVKVQDKFSPVEVFSI